MSTALTEVRPARGAGVGSVLPAALRNLGRRPSAADAALGSPPFPGDPKMNGRWPALEVRELEWRLEKRKREPGGADPRVLHALLAQAAAAHDNRLATVFEQEHQAYAARLYRGDAVGDIREARDRGLDAVRAATEDRRDEVVRARDEARRREDDLEEFRTVEGLRREPQYPENRLNHCLTTAAVGGVEIAMNATLLAGGALGGLAEAMGLAGAIAAVNIGFAFFGGNLARFFNHRSAWKKTLGGAVVLAGGLGLIFFNLLVAHFRQAMQTAADDLAAVEAGRAAWQSFTADYLGIEGVMSWVAALIGMLFAAFAFYKGYSMDDVYPGYGRRARVRRKTQIAFEKARREALADLDDALEEHAENLQAAVEVHRAGVADDRNARTECAALADEFRRQRRDLERALEPLRLTHCPDLHSIRLEDLTEATPLPETPAADEAAVRQESETARQALSAAARHGADSFESGERS